LAQLSFASESFVDELAAATNSDPVEFRLRYPRPPHEIAAVKAAAERAGWESRPSDRQGSSTGAQGTSRSLWEEVIFDRAGVTSVYWASISHPRHRGCDGRASAPRGLHTGPRQGVPRLSWKKCAAPRPAAPRSLT